MKKDVDMDKGKEQEHLGRDLGEKAFPSKSLASLWQCLLCHISLIM